MIEITILNYLKNKNIPNIGTNVFMETPVNPPKRYIIIEKTGGAISNHVFHSDVFAIQSISKNSLVEAATMNAAIINAMLNMADTQPIYSCELNSNYNFTNTTTKEYRYQAVFELYY